MNNSETKKVKRILRRNFGEAKLVLSANQMISTVL